MLTEKASSKSTGEKRGVASKKAVAKKSTINEERIGLDQYLTGLTPSQVRFMIEATGRNNVFLTGVAGTGKSFVVSRFLQYCNDQSTPLGITASTGIAALNIGGSTIHSYLGIGLAVEDVEDLYRNIVKYKKKVYQRILATKVLLIDEVSMISGELLNKINELLRRIFSNQKPFGGIKLVVVGDHLQLPPVTDLKRDYCFESIAWHEANFTNVMLTEVVRQKDEAFSESLSKIRVGDLSGLNLLMGRVNASCGEIEPIKLYSHNHDVLKENYRNLKNILSPSYFFSSLKIGDEKKLESLTRSCPADPTLELKVGAKVMLLWNVDIDLGLCNGSIGVVTGLSGASAKVLFKSGEHIIAPQTWEMREAYVSGAKIKYKIVASITQMPLKLAYALSIHKSQGQTLDSAYIDLSKCFESGQAYVALSRVKDLDSLYLKPFSPSSIKVNEAALNFYKNLS